MNSLRPFLIKVAFNQLLVSLLFFGVGCRGSNVRPVTGSKTFVTEYHDGDYGAHSKGFYTLLAKRNGHSDVIWKGVAGWPLIAWEDVVLFTAVISDTGEVGYLLYIDGLGTIRMDKEIRDYRQRSLGTRKSADMLESRTHWRVAENDIYWVAPEDPPSVENIEIKISVAELVAMAKDGLPKKRKRTFLGNEFFE
jgi:hypothetical protein